MSDQSPGHREYWLEKPGSVDKIWWGLVGVCATLFLADLLYEKHVHYEFEEVPGFYGIYGFISCVVLVLAARELRKVVMRPEDYYEPPGDSPTDPPGEDA